MHPVGVTVWNGRNHRDQVFPLPYLLETGVKLNHAALVYQKYRFMILNLEGSHKESIKHLVAVLRAQGSLY